ESTCDPARASVEPWPATHHKIKVKPPVQWRRLKKFRALRLGAERRGGRLPATMRQVVSKSNYVREAEGDHPSMGRHDASKVPHRRRKPSSEVPLLKQSELSSKNTPELIQVFGMDENLADGHFSLDQPNLSLVLKPAPVLAVRKDCDGSRTCHPVGNECQNSLSQLHQEKTKRKQIKGIYSAFRNWERGETEDILEVNKGNRKANTYHGDLRSQTSSHLAKNKAKSNTYQFSGENQSHEYSNERLKANKNCLLM
ncbi:hypothetical protein ElyMa_006731300, partial [Elysia marginata]